MEPPTPGLHALHATGPAWWDLWIDELCHVRTSARSVKGPGISGTPGGLRRQGTGVGTVVMAIPHPRQPSLAWRAPIAGRRRRSYSRLSEMARSGIKMEATYIGQILMPWPRKLTISPSAASNDWSRLEYRPFSMRMV